MRLARVYANLVASGGLLVLGGVLEAEADDTAEVAAGAGFARRSTLTRQGWATLELIRT